jgi:hypothetical protein
VLAAGLVPKVESPELVPVVPLPGPASGAAPTSLPLGSRKLIGLSSA